MFHGTPHTQSTWVSCSKRFKQKYIYEFKGPRGSSLAINPKSMLVLLMGVGFQCEESNLAGLKKLLQNMQMGFAVDVCHKIANKVGVL